jgi:hypothetical protein
MSYFYSQRALISPPSLPRYFDDDESTARDAQNSDSDGTSTESIFPQPNVIPGIINAVCDLSEIFYEAMTLNTSNEITANGSVTGRGNDVEKRAGLYSRLKEWSEALPKDYQPEYNFTFQSCFLRQVRAINQKKRSS